MVTDWSRRVLRDPSRDSRKRSTKLARFSRIPDMDCWNGKVERFSIESYRFVERSTWFDNKVPEVARRLPNELPSTSWLSHGLSHRISLIPHPPPPIPIAPPNPTNLGRAIYLLDIPSSHAHGSNRSDPNVLGFTPSNPPTHPVQCVRQLNNQRYRNILIHNTSGRYLLAWSAFVSRTGAGKLINFNFNF